MIKKVIHVAALIILVLSSCLCIAPKASAMTGGGSVQDPYIATTCEDLAYMRTGHVKIGNDIDCAGYIYNTPSIVIGYINNLDIDGANHTIRNLTTDAFSTPPEALFINFSGSIKDLTIADSVFSDFNGDGVGAFVSSNQGAGTFSNLHTKNVTIYGDGGNMVGGLIGISGYGNATLVNSSFDGTIHPDGSQFNGGLVGIADGMNIIDSYSSGTISDGPVTGGLVGYTINGTLIQNSYDTFVFSSPNTTNGGLVGNMDDSTIVNSFSAADMRANGYSASVGALVGEFTGGATSTLTNVYFDQTLAGRSNCVGIGSAICNPVNTLGTDNDYFKGNTSHPPLNAWSFDSTWTTKAGQYPKLHTTPLEPTEVTVVPSLTSLTVRWSAPIDNGGTTITSYHLQYARSGTINFVDIPNIASSARSYTIAGLEPHVHYDIQLSAVNLLGEGVSLSLSGIVTEVTEMPVTNFDMPKSTAMTGISLGNTEMLSNTAAAEPIPAPTSLETSEAADAIPKAAHTSKFPNGVTKAISQNWSFAYWMLGIILIVGIVAQLRTKLRASK